MYLSQIEAKSIDPDQIAPQEQSGSGPILFGK